MDVQRLSQDIESLFTTDPDIQLDKMGAGNNRVVYRISNTKRYNIDLESIVVKVEQSGVENKREYNAWNYYKNETLSEHLVPVEHVSPNYTWVIMPYYEPIAPSKVNSKIYNELSDLGSDISRTDFVQDSSGKQYCCDYASICEQA